MTCTISVPAPRSAAGVRQFGKLRGPARPRGGKVDPMARGSRHVVLGWLVIPGLIGVALVAPTVVATPPAPDHKVTICHRTNSNTNPYLVITVDIASAGHLHGGHDTQHLGPIWDPTLKARKIEWGDIIPPYSYGAFSYPGLNWTSQGQAIWANDCRVPAPSSSPTSPTSPPPSSPTLSSSPTPSSNPTASPTASSGPAGSVEGVTGTPNGEFEGIAGTPPPTDSLAGARAPSGDGLYWLALALAGLLGAALLMTPRRPPARCAHVGHAATSTRTRGDGGHRHRPQRAPCGVVRVGPSPTKVLDGSCPAANDWAIVAVPERDTGRGAQPAVPRPTRAQLRSPPASPATRT